MHRRDSSASFAGFPPECFGFLRTLEKNNNRDWFAGHGDDCNRHVLAPATKFVVALGTALKKIYPRLVFDARPTGTGSLFRLARDTRFSKDKTPYKTNLGFRFWLSEEARAAKRIGLYVHLDKAGMRVHGGGHALSREDLMAFREYLTEARNGKELRRVMHELTQRGYDFEAERLARVPAGLPAEHPNADLLIYKSLFAMSPRILMAATQGAEIVDECVVRAAELRPINDWFSRALR